MPAAALEAPAPHTLAQLECAAALLYAAERAETPVAAARLRECAMGVIWYAANRDRLRKSPPAEAVVFRDPPPRGASR